MWQCGVPSVLFVPRYHSLDTHRCPRTRSHWVGEDEMAILEMVGSDLPSQCQDEVSGLLSGQDGLLAKEAEGSSPHSRRVPAPAFSSDTFGERHFHFLVPLLSLAQKESALVPSTLPISHTGRTRNRREESLLKWLGKKCSRPHSAAKVGHHWT